MDRENKPFKHILEDAVVNLLLIGLVLAVVVLLGDALSMAESKPKEKLSAEEAFAAAHSGTVVNTCEELHTSECHYVMVFPDGSSSRFRCGEETCNFIE